jgi:spore coat protein U domain-containing protein, fimbrial subunit CupE1/2/3/6
MLKKTHFGALGTGTALALAAFCLPAPALAGTVGNSLATSATVTGNCTITTTPLAFGNVNTISGSNVDGTGGLSITCTNGTAWTAAAGVGGGTGASYTGRRMVAGANQLGYNLYTAGDYATVWGDGSASTATLGGTGTGSAQAVTVYGRVGSGQTTVPAGSYLDTVAVTVTY